MDVEKGMAIEVAIFDISNEGKGIGRYEGRVVFVSGCLPGDKVLARVDKIKKNYLLASCTKILEPSKDRINAQCPYMDVCGGCTFGELTYEAEGEIKENQVREVLTRLGGLSFLPVTEQEEGTFEEKTGDEENQGNKGDLGGHYTIFEPITLMTEPYRYRNKAQMQVSTGGNIMQKGGIIKNLGPAVVGFYEGHTHNVIDCEDCLLQSEAVAACAKALRTFMAEDNITAWDEKWQQGLMRHMVVKMAYGTGEVMVILVINGKGIPHAEKLVTMLDEAVEETGFHLASVWINVNKEMTGSIFGKDMVPLAGKKVIQEVLGDRNFEVSPRSFYQVNPPMAEALYNKVAEYAQLTGEEYVLDLYCGVGTIGLWLANDAKYVIGIESVKEAVVDANRNAAINGIVNARFVCGKAEEVLPALRQQAKKGGLAETNATTDANSDTTEGEDGSHFSASVVDDQVLQSVAKADVVILDPPRKGCHPALLDAVLAQAPERIVYVSCGPATLARDLAYLCASHDTEGKTNRPVYQVDKVAPFDMFPRTGHVETVVLMSRKEK